MMYDYAHMHMYYADIRIDFVYVCITVGLGIIKAYPTCTCHQNACILYEVT